MTFLGDLDIASANWIHGVNYCGVEPARFLAAIPSVDVEQRLLFIDFGPSKARALLMAPEFPFRRIIRI